MPKICVSIAAESLEQFEKNLSEANDSSADFLEVRFDFLRTADFGEALRLANKIKGRAIYTLRDESELGKFRGKIEERVFWLARLADARPMLLDVELTTLKYDHNLLDYFQKNNTSLLVSWHNPTCTPNPQDLRVTMSEMNRFSKYIKIVTMANSIEDSISVLDLYRDASDSNLIAFAM